MAGGFLAETNTMEAVRDAERCRLQHSFFQFGCTVEEDELYSGP